MLRRRSPFAAVPPAHASLTHGSLVQAFVVSTFIIGAVFSDSSGALGRVDAADLKGAFVLEAEAPLPVPLPVADPNAIRDYPGVKLVYESLMVDPKSRGIANILVYVRTPDVPITDAALGALLPRHVVDVSAGRFEPHVSGIWLGQQSLRFTNRGGAFVDPSFPYAGACGLLYTGADLEIPLPEHPKLIPQELSCNIHPWMKGYIVVRSNPYFAATAVDGTFTLRNLPTGLPLEIQVWHERAGYLQARPAWEKGRFTITLEADQDLGTVQVAKSLLR